MKTFSGTYERGVVALITVIVIGALILIVGLAGSYVGQTEIVISGDLNYDRVSRTMLKSCVEEAMHRLKLNESYVGGTVPLGQETCVVTVSGSGSTRTVSVTSTVSGHTRTVVVSAVRKQNVAGSAKGWSVDSWTEGDPP